MTLSAACTMRRVAQSSLFPSDESPKGEVGAVTVASFRTQRQKNLPKVIG